MCYGGAEFGTVIGVLVLVIMDCSVCATVHRRHSRVVTALFTLLLGKVGRGLCLCLCGLSD